MTLFASGKHKQLIPGDFLDAVTALASIDALALCNYLFSNGNSQAHMRLKLGCGAINSQQLANASLSASILDFLNHLGGIFA